MTNGQKFLLTIIIVLMILFAFAAYGYFTGAWKSGAEAAAKIYIIPERFQKELIELDKKALDEAYTNHVNHLFSTWVSQTPHLGHESSRITTGLANVHEAWVIAMEGIEKREKALNKCVGC